MVILSHRLWQSRLNSDPAIIGRTIALGGKAQTVVGVLPAHFIFPDPAAEPDLYVPDDLDTDTRLESTNISIVMVLTIARLRDGVTLPQAQAELNLFERNRVKGYSPFFVKWAEGRRIVPSRCGLSHRRNNREPLLILLACVAAVLLIACANVANLQLARTVTREPEMALRGALGAGRLRLIRQSLVENPTPSAIASCLASQSPLRPHSSSARAARQDRFSSGLPVADTALTVRQAERSRRSRRTRICSCFHCRPRALDHNSHSPPCSGRICFPHTGLRNALQGASRCISFQRRLRSVLLASEIGLAVYQDVPRGPVDPQLCACTSKRHWLRSPVSYPNSPLKRYV